jgi:putative nucleotidyltransferase with HDIG domain
VVPTREQAWDLLTAHTQNAGLLKHAMGVEAAMRAYAPRFDEDAELWGVVGLLHDLDYEKHPSLEEHPFVGAEILRGEGYSEDIVNSVLGHADHTGVARETTMAKALYAVDELVGFAVAVALVRPTKSITDLPVKSVMKKFKDKAFCRAIDRDHLRTAAEDLGVDMRDHVQTVIASLATIAGDLELN